MMRLHVPNAPSLRKLLSGRARSWALPVLAALALPGCGTEVEADDDAVDAVVASASLPAGGEDALDFTPPGAERGFADRRAESADAGGHYTVLYSERDAEIRARSDGHVRTVHAEIGDPVASGQLLASLESEEAAAAVASAEAALEYARHQEERTRVLAQGELTTRVELEEATYLLRAAEAELQEATARLERTRIRAPFGGVVTRRFVRLGTYVEEGDPLYRVTALRPLRALLRVPEAAAPSISRGDPMSLEAVDGTRVAGRVARIAPAVDPASGTVDVLVDVDEPGSLRPGSSVRVVPGAHEAPAPDEGGA
ncbi:MAG TPA: efflux RND transporter periplasmic adaptor subunit [Longimicrobiales bacterium]|nr:efflux RND transporter periplasmic adaptor subunit [Longimicrobiales bacterium]